PLSPVRRGYYLYKLEHASFEEFQGSLESFAKGLDLSNVDDEGLIDTINHMQYIPETQSILFAGSEISLKRVKEMAPLFDANTVSLPVSNEFYTYKPRYQKGDQILHSIQDLVANLKKDQFADLPLLRTLESVKFIKQANSLLFTGDSNSLKKVDSLLATLDVPLTEKPIEKSFYIYKLQNATTDQIEEDLDKLLRDLSQSDLSDTKLVTAIEQIRYVKETNSLLITGTPTVIEELKSLIAQYDLPQDSAQPVSSDFFMYKPQHLQAQEIEKSLQDVGDSLKQAGLADVNLLQTISSAKYVATTNSIIFTGSTDSLQKIQSLLQDIDVPPKTHTPIQHVGKTTFLLYKLKNAGGPQIVSALRSMEENLRKSGSDDKEFLAALDSMKYVKETNSLLFTGTEAALTRIETLLANYDVSSLAAPSVAPVEKTTSSPTSTNFFVYRPVSVSGVNLERMMQDFAENLKMSGLSDPDLFNAIAS
ncbi:MAG: hypothetical protein HY324_01690, partial [Chlamydiia bacterium]|nr:hypothetical protein [Chlamydiia bacterium]